MSVALTKFYTFSGDLAKSIHNLTAAGDQLRLALCNAANAPVVGDAVLTDLTVIAYTNITENRNVAINAGSGSTLGVYKLLLDDLTLNATGPVAAFQYVVLYNDSSPADSLIGFADYGSELTLSAGESLLVDWDGSAGAITVQ